jgi:hypothetical protein
MRLCKTERIGCSFPRAPLPIRRQIQKGENPMSAAHETLREVAHSEVLSPKATRYKRNAMLLALVLAGVHLTTWVNFDGLSIFGVTIGSHGSRRSLALALLWLSLAYNAGWAGYLCWSDLRRWISKITDQWPDDVRGVLHFFPEIGMYWGDLPSDAVAKRKYSGNIEFKGWVEMPDKAERLMKIGAQVVTHTGQQTLAPAFEVPKILAGDIRETWWSVFWETCPAAACVGAAIFGLLWELAGPALSAVPKIAAALF